MKKNKHVFTIMIRDSNRRSNPIRAPMKAKSSKHTPSIYNSNNQPQQTDGWVTKVMQMNQVKAKLRLSYLKCAYDMGKDALNLIDEL